MGRVSARQRIFIFLAVLLLPHALMAETLNIGSTSDMPAQEIKAFSPLATYLGKELHAEGITEGQVVVGRSLSESAMLLRNGKIDLYIDSPFPSLVLSHLSGSKLLVRRWKKGVGEYHSIISREKTAALTGWRISIKRFSVLKRPTLLLHFFCPRWFCCKRNSS